MRPATLETLEPRRLLSGNPAITINDVALVEGDAGQSAIVFTVSLSKPSTKRVSVDFATENGSAVAGEDFVSKRGTLDFARGQTSKTVTVLVSGDAAVEGDETFSLKLSRAQSAFIADARGLATILNDDVLPPQPPVEPPPYQPPPDYPTYTDPGYYDPGWAWDPSTNPYGTW
jgi:hypothetical protein